MPRTRLRRLPKWLILLAFATPALLSGGEAYFTGFETFTVGDDTIANTDGWIGTHTGQKLHGIMSENLHGVLGIGKAAYLGGNATTNSTSTSKTVYVRRPVNLDPIALNQEIATFSVVFGIKDSSATSLIAGSDPASYKRDNFEFLIYNNDSAPALLGGVQFDNTTLDSTSGKPRRLIYRLARNAASGLFEYLPTGYAFLPETLEPLKIRINFRTNRWTVSLSEIPIVQDLPFYSGSAAKTLGSVMVKMAVTHSDPTTGSILPGDNYLFFDDYLVRTDAPSTAVVIRKTADSAAQLIWNVEAGYSYQVQSSDDLKSWNTGLQGSTHTATVTGSATFTDPTSPVPVNRLYRIQSSGP